MAKQKMPVAPSLRELPAWARSPPPTNNDELRRLLANFLWGEISAEEAERGINLCRSGTATMNTIAECEALREDPAAKKAPAKKKVSATPREILRYIVLRDGVIAKFPWTVIDADSGEPALWQDDAKVGKVPLRFPTEALARAAADQLIAEERKK